MSITSKPAATSRLGRRPEIFGVRAHQLPADGVLFVADLQVAVGPATLGDLR